MKNLKYFLLFMFKVDKDESGAKTEDPGLKMEFVYAVHDAIRTLVRNPL